jgi:hypothetical protein
MPPSTWSPPAVPLPPSTSAMSALSSAAAPAAVPTRKVKAPDTGWLSEETAFHVTT